MKNEFRFDFLVVLVCGALLICGGCHSTSVAYRQDRMHPLIRVTNEGLKFQGKPATPDEVVKRLHKLGVPTDDELYVQVDEDYTDQRALWVFTHNYLHKAGYRRAILIHPRRSEAGMAGKVESQLGERVVPFEGKMIKHEAPVRVTPPRGAVPQRRTR